MSRMLLTFLVFVQLARRFCTLEDFRFIFLKASIVSRLSFYN